MSVTEKTWSSPADGIWKYENGTYYERPKVSGRWTFRSLKTKNLKLAKEELIKHKAEFVERDPIPQPQVLVTTGEVIRKYEKTDTLTHTGNPEQEQC